MSVIKWSERSAVTLTSTGASLTNGSGAAAGTDLDVRASGNAGQDFAGAFELTCQWGTVTGISAGTVVADLFIVPKLDGTNLPQIDLTAGSSYIPFAYKVGGFTAAKAPTASTDTRFVLPSADLMPVLYTAHLINRSGQTISANWTLKAVTAQAQSV